MIDEKRIRWRCRRGMKELDVMLERYLASGYGALREEDKGDFARLLDALDPELFAWLTGTGLPADLRLQRIVTHIRGALAASAAHPA
ncbi:MAG: succinate dehydrogenase assembly factor 2 [Gammaproteobacteria bacterium]|nr:succinate dehydrogenase assembly factor 2 [Gammaproteobacteria bacterium]MCG3142890.1 FAD assembly factor SdhE [Gammaproteobacteria bacterium]